MKKFALGIGDFSKRYLKPNELLFQEWKFGILDCWSKVQFVEVIEEEIEHSGGGSVQFMRDLSYFITQPNVAIRFGNDKYDWSETQKVLKLTPHYSATLKSLREENLSTVHQQISEIDQLLIVMKSCDPIAVGWLADLLKAFEQSTKKIQVLSINSVAWEGSYGVTNSKIIGEQLNDLNIEHYSLLQNDLSVRYRQKTLKEYYDVVDSIFFSTLSEILNGKLPTSPMISKIENDLT